MSEVLFPEIYDVIIDNMYDDKQSLSKMGLVCHAFFAPTRYHLFRTLKLHKMDRASILAAVLGHGAAAYVVDLTMDFEDMSEWFTYVRETVDPKWFVNLERVGLSGVGNWNNFHNNAWKFINVLLEKSVQLSLSFVEFNDTYELRRLLEHTKRLNALILRFVTFKQVNEGDHKLAKPVELEKLVLQGNESLKIIPHYVQMESIKTLGISRLKKVHGRAASLLLEQAGPNLEHLSLNLSTFDEGTLSKNLRVDHCSQLKTIRFPCTSWTQSVAWICDVLSRLTSPVLSTVIILLDSKPGEILFKILAPLATVFNTLPSRTVLRFEIFGWKNIGFEKSKENLVSQLTTLNKEGRLQVISVHRGSPRDDAALWQI